MSSSLLVTGGAGFVGANFVRHAIATTDHRITVLDKLTYAANLASLADLPPGRLTVVAGDVADAPLVDDLVAHADAVVHFAAESHNDRSLAEPRTFVDTNVVGTFTLLEAVRRHGTRYHHISTDEVFGALDLDEPRGFTEGSPYDPSSPYSATKAASDMLVRAWVRSFGIRATLSNSSNNYGPYQHVEKFIPRQITNILRGERARIYGDGAHVRDWIHVDDHSAAVLAILERGTIGETYLVGADGEHSNRSVVEMLLRLMGRPADDVIRVPDRPGHDRRYAIDATRLRRELGWEPAHRDLEAGLRATIDWYRTHEAWWADAKAAAEAFYAAEGR